tara:strand:+ start:734 stop:3343 length:2610 start_codon:yes stop_codon:yes gene_type:complete
MSKITDESKLEFLRSQWNNKPLTKTPVSPADKKVTDPIKLSTLRGDPTAEENWLEDPMMASRALLDGAFWGWSDEVGASISAAMYQTFLQPEESEVQLPQALLDREVQPEGLDLPTSQPSSYNNVRREMMTNLEEERQAWASENQGLNLGLNLLGGLASGGAVYGGVKAGLGVAGTQLAKVPVIQQGTRAVQQARVQRSLNQASQAPKNATAFEASVARDAAGKNLKKFGPSPMQAAAAEVPALAATGALASAGFAGQDDDLGDAMLKGAALSVLIGGPLTGVVNYVANGATTNRIAQQLGKGRDFVPIGMAALKNSVDKAEKALEYGYNKIVRHAFGADSLIKQQQKRWTTLADQELANVENTIESSITTANRALARTKQNEAVVLDKAVEAVKTQKNLTKDERKIALKEAADNIKLNAVADADAATNAAQAALRVQAQKDAIPAGTPKATINYIFSLPNMHARQQEINALWADSGFEMLKNKKFRINPQEIAVKVRTAVGSEREFLATLSGNKPVNAANVIDEYLTSYVTKGNWIEGVTLNNLRTTVAQMANDLGTEGADAANKMVLKELVKVLDDAVMPQLSDKSRATFLAQKTAWGQNVVVRDAVVGATKKNGMFTPEEYLGSVKKNNRWSAGEGTGYLQPEANKVIQQTAASDKAIKDLAVRQSRTQAVEGVRETRRLITEAEQRVKVLESQSKSRVLSAESKTEALNKLEVENIRLDNLKATISGYSTLVAKTDASPFFKLFSTALLGLGNPVRGLAVGSMLGTQSVQRTLAGQAAWQKALNKGLQVADKPVSRVVQAGGRGIEAEKTAQEGSSSTSLNPLQTASAEKQLQAYDKLKKAGKLETLKVKNPKVYQALIKANSLR